MAVFDAEAYLRAVGARWEPERYEPGVLCNPVLAATAAALVAVDAITLEHAQAIIAGYSPAPAPGTAPSHLTGAAAAQDTAPPPPDTARLRVVPCDQVIDQPWGRLTIRCVVFTDQATSLRVTLRPDESQPASLITFLPQARRVSITDASGTTAAAEFSGGFRHGELDWHGQYEARPPLAADTPWIELLGEQVQLTAEPVSIQAWTEPLHPQDPATRHLWERVATLNDFHNPHLALEATIAALTIAGAIPAGDSAAGTPGQRWPCCGPAVDPPEESPVTWPGHGLRCSHAGAGPAARSLRSRSALSHRHSTA